ncbi:MAG TPA: PTS fructose transporter subunit IIA [Candidatus Polarisedimenticolia bacterium]|nr:PTS fructose transporter subunit IIA [Candidatus Polarisedimenticolia bacterium]
MTLVAEAAGEARFGVLVVTHGGLAFELVRALERIVGKVDGLKALTIGWDDDLQQARQAVEQAIADVDPGGGVLILTDMFGGTATNVTLAFLRDGVEIVTGVNLPMLIKYANIRDKCSLREAAARIKEQGQRSIAIATEYLDPSPRE